MGKYIVILIGLYLDGFVYMMQTGATIRLMDWKKSLGYALEYSGVASGMAMLGYGCARLFQNNMSGKLEMFTAGLIIFFLGMSLFVRAIFARSTYVEKLDKSFDYRKLFRIAVIANIHVFVLGAGFAFMGSGFINLIELFFIFGFVMMLIALHVGYQLGAGYQRVVKLSGGMMMVFFAVWILVEYVL